MNPLIFNEAVYWAKKRKVILPDKYYSEANKSYRTLTFSIAGINNLNVLADTLDSLTNAIQSGTNFKEWKVKAKENLLLNNKRLHTIYHTNIQSAYNSGIYQRQKENIDINPIYMYVAVRDKKTRPAHYRWNGYLARYDDPIWLTHTPLCGYNCRCMRIAVSLAKSKELGYGKQPKLIGMPDKGFDYNKTLGLKKGVDIAQQQAKNNIVDSENKLRNAINPSGKAKNSILYAMFLYWISKNKQ
jgi:SPP1 gp7 family putative phage head morphogenesis protein